MRIFKSVSVKWRLISTVYLLAIICFTCSDCLLANNNYYKNPKAILIRISKHGARKVVNELYNNPNHWSFILQHIAKGKTSWLKVAVALHHEADGAVNEMLCLSVGEALEVAPANVLKITLSEFSLQDICKSVDVDDFRYNSSELAKKAIDRRIRSISVITDPELKCICIKCIQLLKESKNNIDKYYNKAK